MNRNYQAERIAEEKRHDEELLNIQRFGAFLQGKVPKDVTIPRNSRIKKMSAKQAMTVIWFLQEVCHILPDRYEMCADCDVIYDSHREGRCIDKTGKCYCDSCGPTEGAEDL